MADAGRILIIPKGTYDASVAYEMLDLVKHNGVTWCAKQDCIGVEPSAENSAYWFPMVETDASSLGGETAEAWQQKIDSLNTGKADATHEHTKEDVGLGNVDNTSDAEKHVLSATSADALSTARTIELTGDVSGSVAFNGSADASIEATVKDSSHNHVASNITAGTLAGKVVANATAVATLANKQVRNIYAGTSSMTAGTTALPSGDIYIKYK